MFEHDTESRFLTVFLGKRLSDFSKIENVRCLTLEGDLKLQTRQYPLERVFRFFIHLNLLTLYLLSVLRDSRKIVTSFEAFDRPPLGTPFILLSNCIGEESCMWTYSTVRY